MTSAFVTLWELNPLPICRLIPDLPTISLDSGIRAAMRPAFSEANARFLTEDIEFLC